VKMYRLQFCYSSSASHLVHMKHVQRRNLNSPTGYAGKRNLPSSRCIVLLVPNTVGIIMNYSFDNVTNQRTTKFHTNV